MPLSPAFISGFLGFILTLLVFSYILGDNPLFRITIYIFVGVSSGYVAAVAWHQVLWPDLFLPLLTGSMTARLLLLIPLILSILLLMKISPSLSKLGTVPMAFLVGIGAAVAVGGAVMGTIFPQLRASINVLDMNAAALRGIHPVEQLIEGSIILVGITSTLIYFHFGAKPVPGGSAQRHKIIEGIALLGRVFIAITFGVLFAGVYSAAMTALIERLNSFLTFFALF